MIHESWLGNGFCYRRLNSTFKNIEYLAFAGFFCPHTDNPNWY